jgi:hypothetical protein
MRLFSSRDRSGGSLGTIRKRQGGAGCGFDFAKFTLKEPHGFSSGIVSDTASSIRLPTPFFHVRQRFPQRIPLG